MERLKYVRYKLSTTVFLLWISFPAISGMRWQGTMTMNNQQTPGGRAGYPARALILQVLRIMSFLQGSLR